jgi:NagD protein
MGKKGFLIDMDGVICRGGLPIPGAMEFVNKLKKSGYPFLLLTNNSQGAVGTIVSGLRRLGFNVRENDILTSAMATASYLTMSKTVGTAFVVGEGGVREELQRVGYKIVDKKPDYVVIGEGFVGLESVSKVVEMVLGGAKLIAANLETASLGDELEEGSSVGCGAFIAMVELATGRKAFSVGKPSPFMMRMARKKLQLTTGETVMVGDTMETDILGASVMGFTTVLTLSGVTQRDVLDGYGYSPDFVVDSVEDLLRGDVFDGVVTRKAVERLSPAVQTHRLSVLFQRASALRA